MSVAHPLFWFAVCALCLAFCAVVARGSAFYRARLAESGTSRFETVDGLRGFLALGVFGLHAVTMYKWHVDGAWVPDGAPFYEFAAKSGVGLFFMITAFLFWLRVLRAGEGFDWSAFYLSRLKRLTPMYAASVLLALVVIGAATGFVLQSDPADLAREVRPWLSFGFIETGDVNGFTGARHVNAVYWTLAYEWLFYLALPLLALFARHPWGLLPASAVLLFGSHTSVVYNFLFGALVAFTVHRRLLAGRLTSPWLGLLALAALAAAFALRDLHPLAETLALSVFFLLVVHGCSIFGLLRTRPAKLLGTVSYSIYLVHCIVLFAIVHAADAVVPMERFAPHQYWVLAAAAAIGAVAVSMLTYRYVEYPFLADKPARRRVVSPVSMQPT